MKTLIIYNDCIKELQYCIIDGDYSYLSGVMINSGQDEELERVSENLLFDRESGEPLLQFSTNVSIAESKNWNRICVITFLP